VKLLVDMNLSPSWVDRLARHGFEAVHWSTIGAATAPDSKRFNQARRPKYLFSGLTPSAVAAT
jgi:predicted nuclease of predicted toxin-antitoxin system